MENSSRALFIAAGVILGVLLLSIMIFVFRQGARVNEAYDQKQITNQLELYNARFEAYDRDNNNIMDIISLVNLAYNTNASSGFDNSVEVTINVKIGGKNFFINSKLKDRNKIFKQNTSTEIPIYNLANQKISDFTTITGSLGGANSLDKLSKAKLHNGTTYYRYLFKVTDFKYHMHNGKVSQISLEAYINNPKDEFGNDIVIVWD